MPTPHDASPVDSSSDDAVTTQPVPGLETNGVVAAKTPSRTYWLHPVCFALFPVLALYAANLDQIPYPDAIRPVLGALLLAVTLGGAIFCVVRDARRTALLLTVVLFFLFSYGHINDLAERLTTHDTVAGIVRTPFSPTRHGLLLAVWGVLLALALFLAYRVPRLSLRTLTPILNVVGAVLVTMPVVAIATHLSSLIGPSADRNVAPDPINAALRKVPANLADKPTRDAPDIYYIILDAYGREDVLEKFYGFTNHPFVQALRRRGFFVADRARPNYGQTIESISSSLNMTYLDKVAARMGPDYKQYDPLAAMVDRNAVAAALRPKGYRFVAVTTGFGMTAPSSADLLVGEEEVDKRRSLTPFDVLALDITPFANLPENEKTLFDNHRNELLQGFHDLGEIPRLPYRKFVFAHILAPHPPFVFGPNGEHTHPPNRAFSIADGSDFMHHGSRGEYKSGYIAQLQYVNTLVLRAIDAIYATSRVRPVIIVQGDHGPRMFVDWDSLERTDVRETYGNLNAFELPDGSASTVFYDDITPVNSFRLLLDHYFDAGYARLPDRSYYATLDLPYQFKDVTDRSNP